MAEPVKGERTVEEIARAVVKRRERVHVADDGDCCWENEIAAVLREERDRGDRLAERVTAAECQRDYLEDQLADKHMEALKLTGRVMRLEKALREIADGTTDTTPPYRAMGTAQMKDVARSALAAPTGKE